MKDIHDGAFPARSMGWRKPDAVRIRFRGEEPHTSPDAAYSAFPSR